MISQGQYVIEAGFSELHKDFAVVQEHLEGIVNKVSESKSDREPRVSTGYDR